MLEMEAASHVRQRAFASLLAVLSCHVKIHVEVDILHKVGLFSNPIITAFGIATQTTIHVAT